MKQACAVCGLPATSRYCSAHATAQLFTYPRPPKPRHIALLGQSGTGKSELAQALAHRHAFTHLSIDHHRGQGGDWPQLLAEIRARHRTDRLVIESIATPKAYRQMLPVLNALLVEVQCDQAIRRQRLADRPDGLRGDYRPLVKAHLIVRSDEPYTDDLVNQVAARATQPS